MLVFRVSLLASVHSYVNIHSLIIYAKRFRYTWCSPVRPYRYGELTGAETSRR